MTDPRMLYVTRHADGAYHDRHGRVRIVRDHDTTDPWILYVDACFYGRWPTLTDARTAARDLVDPAGARQAVTA